MDKLKDYYRILGVPRDATAAAIRRAYQRLARRLRPRGGRKAPPEELHEVQQAYEILSNATRRRDYDDLLRAPESDSLPPLAAFQHDATRGELRRPVWPMTLSGEILLSPAEARAGGALALDMPVAAPCPACRRTGGAALACDRCGGEGRVERRLPVAVRIPAGVREGAVFQVHIDEPDVQAILLTVHITTPH